MHQVVARSVSNECSDFCHIIFKAKITWLCTLNLLRGCNVESNKYAKYVCGIKQRKYVCNLILTLSSSSAATDLIAVCQNKHVILFYKK